MEIQLLSVDMLSSYLRNRTQQIKINVFFSLRHETEYSAPSGSILGPLLFNINGIDLFFEFENNHIASSADDTKPLLIQATLILQSLKNCLPPRHLSLV